MSEIGRQVDALVAWLRKNDHGKEIGRRGQAGDETCNKIMGWYEALRRCPEAGALIALEGYIDKIRSDVERACDDPRRA